jgi:hypothetical protein
MRLEDVLAALPQDQREAVETRFQALQIELAHATGAAIIANDRPIEDALRAEIDDLQAELARWKWLYNNDARMMSNGPTWWVRIDTEDDWWQGPERPTEKEAIAAAMAERAASERGASHGDT